MPLSSGIKCYRCTVLPAQYLGDADQPCSRFDKSSQYYADCPSSTFCMKRIFRHHLVNGSRFELFVKNYSSRRKYFLFDLKFTRIKFSATITTAERNCAFQKYVLHDYNYNARQWDAKEKVDEYAYSEGCVQGFDRGSPSGPSDYCYCDSDFCNGSVVSMGRYFIVVVILAVLLM